MPNSVGKVLVAWVHCAGVRLLTGFGGKSSRFTILGCCIQLFRERLSEKVHATIPKGIVGGFVCPVLQRNLKEWHERPRTYVGECWWKATKVGSTATVVRNSVLIISHITFRGCRVHIFSDNLSRNSCITEFWIGFLKVIASSEGKFAFS